MSPLAAPFRKRFWGRSSFFTIFVKKTIVFYGVGVVSGKRPVILGYLGALLFFVRTVTLNIFSWLNKFYLQMAKLVDLFNLLHLEYTTSKELIVWLLYGWSVSLPRASAALHKSKWFSQPALIWWPISSDFPIFSFKYTYSSMPVLQMH